MTPPGGITRTPGAIARLVAPALAAVTSATTSESSILLAGASTRGRGVRKRGTGRGGSPRGGLGRGRGGAAS